MRKPRRVNPDAWELGTLELLEQSCKKRAVTILLENFNFLFFLLRKN
jgi:hypothetical protein